ncbi:Na+/H+ antiporter subunit E [Microbacterium sp. ACRRU]|uniref:Na+/H+ antiporter subunit E n=1 Tax=Microbacterium sp. ACRRU TaxID=2918204 RepID=UPI001EF43271|nr:Na+/H+ antiporter subunit E [Microbacterium sp. ACRRU]MCG7418303.1 Na+/H+ antiporter subunit E [Microbacterium sp. ACRRU]
MIRVLTLPFRLLGFVLWFLWQIVLSSGAVLLDVVTPGSRATPRVVRLDMGDARDGHVTVLSVLITLTPGTLTLGVERTEEGGREILVHSVYDRDAEAALADLRDIDRRLVAATTGRPRS